MFGKPKFHTIRPGIPQYSRRWKNMIHGECRHMPSRNLAPTTQANKLRTHTHTHNSLFCYDQLERPQDPNTPWRWQTPGENLRHFANDSPTCWGGAGWLSSEFDAWGRPQTIRNLIIFQRHGKFSALSRALPFILCSLSVYIGVMHVIANGVNCGMKSILPGVQKCEVQSAHHVDSELHQKNWERHGQLWPNVNVIHLGSALTYAAY